jgi:PAS domain-containing protein
MQIFILQQNAARFRARLSEARDEDERGRLQAMLSTVERELALLDAQRSGAGAPPWPIGGREGLEASRARLTADFRQRFEHAPQVAYLIDPGPGLCFVAVNAAFEQATDLMRSQIEGEPLFSLFPDNPDEANADGTWLTYASMRKVAETGRPDPMPVMRYDVRNAEGVFVERYWRQVNSPLFNEDGRLIFLLHQVDEVTEAVLKGAISAA